MGKITDIQPQARNKGRVNLYIDDKFFCGLEKLTVLSHRLQIGDEVDPDALGTLVADSEATTAFDKAAKYLGMRPRTEKEMRTYLEGKNYMPETVDATLAKLKAYGYIDDAEYCRMYIETYRHKSGARKLAAELWQKGVARELADEALQELDDQSEEVTRMAEKYLRSHAPDKQKLTAYLLRHGFAYETVKSALRALDVAFVNPYDED